MANLRTRAKEFKAECEMLKSDIMQNFGVEDIIKMNSTDFEVMKKTLHLLETSENLLIAEFEAIDEINRKLDILLRR